MEIKNQIKTLFKEAELYRSQGLLAEAQEKYRLVAELIHNNKQLSNRAYLLDELSKKIGATKEEFEKARNLSRSPKLPTKVQDLIKSLFSFSKEQGEDAAELEGAVALAKFGQFERAIVEFNRLLKRDALRVIAAKNILRCHVALGDFEAAVNHYEQWRSSVNFSLEELENVRVFLHDILEKKGIKKDLPSLVETPDVEEGGPPEEELLDIVSIGITIGRGGKKPRFLELDVNFQRGNTISLMISSEDKDLVDSLQVGVKLDEVEFSSPFAVFTGAGIVSARTRIDSGPKEGHYMLDLKIQSA
jgi:tetratricopeptide (TPR) repeat protein